MHPRPSKPRASARSLASQRAWYVLRHLQIAGALRDSLDVGSKWPRRSRHDPLISRRQLTWTVLQGAPLPGIRIGLLLVLVACNTAGAAKYGETCSLDTDCEEKRAPHCQVFFEDKSYEHNDM